MKTILERHVRLLVFRSYGVIKAWENNGQMFFQTMFFNTTDDKVESSELDLVQASFTLADLSKSEGWRDPNHFSRTLRRKCNWWYTRDKWEGIYWAYTNTDRSKIHPCLPCKKPKRGQWNVESRIQLSFLPQSGEIQKYTLE